MLAMAGQLRRAINYEDVQGLFRHLCQEIRSFEAELQARRENPDDIAIARYAICGFLDEAILNTPWGGESGWSAQTLLAEFHNDATAGERMFELVERMKQEPGRYLPLLEVIYVVLSLGFQGRYRGHPRGYDELERIRADLYGVISRQRPTYERELSPRWQGVEDDRPKLAAYLPWWVMAIGAAGILAVVYFFAFMSLSNASDPLAGQVAQIGRDLPPVINQDIRVPEPVFQQRTLQQLLATEARQGTVQFGSDPNTAILRQLFPSGGVTVANSTRGVLSRIATALNELSGRVVISGHTDNVPITRSLRFPSNWELSKARAQAVLEILADAGVQRNRMSAVDRADTDPVCTDCNQDDPKIRAENRRVEVKLLGRAGRE
jgi:type VI secretion system protein ImpK